MALASVSVARADEPAPVWSQNFDYSKARALRRGADMMICFTVRDWSAVCRKFEEHFLHQPDFINGVEGAYELVHFDLSLGDDSPGAELLARFEIAAYPTVVLADSQGVPYAVTGFRPGDISSYVEHVWKLRAQKQARQQLRAQARNVQGVERAGLLAQAVPPLGAHRSAKFYGDMMREAIILDPNDTTGFIGEFEFQLADLAYIQELRRLDEAYQWRQMAELTDRHIENMNLTGSRKQAALMNRFDIERRQGSVTKMVGTLREIVELNPYNPHGRQASQILQTLSSELHL